MSIEERASEIMATAVANTNELLDRARGIRDRIAANTEFKDFAQKMDEVIQSLEAELRFYQDLQDSLEDEDGHSPVETNTIILH